MKTMCEMHQRYSFRLFAILFANCRNGNEMSQFRDKRHMSVNFTYLYLVTIKQRVRQVALLKVHVFYSIIQIKRGQLQCISSFINDFSVTFHRGVLYRVIIYH